MEPREVERLVRWALIEDAFEPRRGPGEFYVSELAACPRRAALNALFNADPMPVEPGPAVRGRLLHEVLRLILGEQLRDAQFEVECSHPVAEGVVLRGRADMVYAGEVYEFKFSSPYSGARELAFKQANAYAIMLGLRRFHVVVIDLDRDVDVKAFSGEADEEAFKQLCADAVKASEAVEARDPFSLPMSPWEWACKNCMWWIICKRVKTISGPGP